MTTTQEALDALEKAKARARLMISAKRSMVDVNEHMPYAQAQDRQDIETIEALLTALTRQSELEKAAEGMARALERIDAKQSAERGQCNEYAYIVLEGIGEICDEALAAYQRIKDGKVG